MGTKKNSVNKAAKVDLRPRRPFYEYAAVALLVGVSAFAALALAAAFSSCATAPSKPPSMVSEKDAVAFRKVARGSVQVHAESTYEGQTVGGQGSGTLVWSDGTKGLILTCSHVVIDEHEALPHQKFSIVGPDGMTADAIMVEDRPEFDLALLLALTDVGGAPLQVATVEPDMYDKLLIVASPHGHKGTAALGILSSKAYKTSEGLPPLWQVTSFIFPGSSGGTVTNERAELVAVPRAVSVAGTFGIPAILPEIGYCVGLREIRKVLTPYLGGAELLK